MNARRALIQLFRRQPVKIIALAAAKGGVGKSTLTAALATAAALDMPHSRIGMVDLDPQGSLTQWWNHRAQERPLFYDLAGASLAEAMPGLRAAEFDVLFADCPPGFSRILRETIEAADLVLVPAQASALDLAAIASTVEMCELARVLYRTLLSRAIFHSRIAGGAVRLLRERGGMLWPPIHQRVEHAMAMARGRTALETQPDGAAAREIAALWRSVRAVLDAAPGRMRFDPSLLRRLAVAGRIGA
jgi:chromosome partitioning protein